MKDEKSMIFDKTNVESKIENFSWNPTIPREPAQNNQKIQNTIPRTIYEPVPGSNIERIIRIVSHMNEETLKNGKGDESDMDEEFLEKVGDAFIKALPAIFRISAQLLADLTRRLMR